jgi:UDP-N-acetylglucosamine diphosphorylase / glucose-1-phosphate thymidylyltransferase / UDP-N-acetylgalactosamine diphosphorylase / glucosamine-1-phosphate N-acetyltransferase / galactosamine-1-phosphate N-acetyltransferase
MRLVIFEPENFRNFFPIAHLRPTFALRCGASLLYEKTIRNHPGLPVSMFCRDSLTETFAGDMPPGCSLNELATLENDLLIINGNLLIGEWMLESHGPEAVGVTADGELLYARISRTTAASLPRKNIHSFLAAVAANLPRREIMDMNLLRWQWELVSNNAEAIASDFRLDDRKGVQGWFHESVTVYGPANRLFVAAEAEIHPQVVIDTHGGPVTVESGAVVMPHSRLEGPCHIGPGTHITRGNIRAGCSIGPDCRVGGEVEESIVHGRTNKYHDGFLGHSYLGEWVNIGAQTVTSDLKNDYSEVSVYMQTGQEEWEFVPTGSQKVGSFIGDHVKTGIGTLLNTGSNIGTGAVLLAADGMLSKFVPSFCWLVDNAATGGFGLDGMLDIARTVVERRGDVFTSDYKSLLESVFALTEGEREIVRGGGGRADGCGHGPAPDSVAGIVAGLLASLLGLDPESLEEDMRLAQDLGVESLDRLRLVAVLEDTFGIKLAGLEIARAATIGEIALLVEDKL